MMNDWTTIDWDKFHFLRPEFLYALAAVAFIFLIGFFSFRDEEKWKKNIAVHLRPYVIQKGSGTMRMIVHSLLSVFMAIACLGLAGPTWNEVEVPGKILETPVVIALDLSQSMMATDIQPTRLERAKFKINDLLDANPHARIALVGFAGTAHTIVPLCTDYNIIKSHLTGLSPDVLPYPGSDVEAALFLTDSITKVSDAPSRLILITDDFDAQLFEHIQAYINQGNRIVEVLPMNTFSGADVTFAKSKRVQKDENGDPVHSALNQNVLNQLSSLKSVHVNQLTLDNSDMAHISDLIAKDLSFQEQAEKKENLWVDRGIWLAIPLALFLLMWFRKGFVIYGLLFIGLASCTNEMSFEDLWYTKDYQAQKIVEAGDYTAAAETFEDPMRKGVAYFKAGDYESAITAFNQDTSAEAAYNLGLAYYKNGDYAAAQLAFGEAVEKNPDMKDAAKNQQIALKMMGGADDVDPEEAQEKKPAGEAQNEQNKGPEDLSGGGQEATKEDMEQERKEETVNTDVRKGKELEEVPDNFEAGEADNSQKVLMRKVDDDPSLFLKRKFAHEVKVKKMKPKKGLKKW